MKMSKFIRASQLAVKWYYEVSGHHKDMDINEIYVVWSCFILGNNKALLSTPELDGRYFEVTYNKEADEMYLDVYKKEANIPFKVDTSEGVELTHMTSVKEFI